MIMHKFYFSAKPKEKHDYFIKLRNDILQSKIYNMNNVLPHKYQCYRC